VENPLDGNHGRGITIDVETPKEAEEAYDVASAASKTRSIIVFKKTTRVMIIILNS